MTIRAGRNDNNNILFDSLITNIIPVSIKSAN
jgi:hypothetical protein